MTIKAVVIGINYKETPQYRLNGCARDASNVIKQLKLDGVSDIATLSDDIKGATKPTASNIKSALKKAVDSAKSGDTIFIHYSGHGTETRDRNHDEDDGKDSAIFTSDLKLVTDDEIKSLLVNTKGVKIVGLFDCCNSGTIGDLPFSSSEPTEISQVANQNYAEIVFVTGCLDDQTSAETTTPEGVQGALTQAWDFMYAHKNGSLEFINACQGDEDSKLAVGVNFNKWMQKRGFTQVVNINWGGIDSPQLESVSEAHETPSILDFINERFNHVQQQLESLLPKKHAAVEEKSPKSLLHKRPRVEPLELTEHKHRKAKSTESEKSKEKSAHKPTARKRHKAH